MEYSNVSELVRRGSILRKILFIAGNPWSLIHFRGSLISELRNLNYLVFTASNPPNLLERKQLKKLGVIHEDLNLSTNKISILNDINYFFKLRKIIKKVEPNIVIAYTMKPVVYAGLNLLRTGKETIFFPLITGLGHYFNSKKLNGIFIKQILIFLLRFSLLASSKTIFQNKENLKTFIKYNIVPSTKAIIVEGSGVDIEKFKKKLCNKNKKKEIVFLLMGRLQIDKGIHEFIKAALLIKKDFPKTRFLILGEEDRSKNAIKLELVKKYQAEGTIEYYGFVNEVQKYIALSDVYVLPSYHEGLPRSSLEAMAMEKPILTTNVSGCKETVINGKNGFKVAMKDVNSLYKKMLWFIKNKNKLKSMGRKSREIVIKRFSKQIINAQMIKIITGN